jgi:hypothetical protein
MPTRRIIPINVAPGGVVPTPKAAGDGAGVNRNILVKSKILAHFIKKKDFPLTYGNNSYDSKGTGTP